MKKQMKVRADEVKVGDEILGIGVVTNIDSWTERSVRLVGSGFKAFIREWNYVTVNRNVGLTGYELAKRLSNTRMDDAMVYVGSKLVTGISQPGPSTVILEVEE